MAGLQQTQLGQTLQQGGGQTNTLTSQVATQQSAPLVVPVFPIRPAPPPTSSHYSPYSPSSILLIFLSVLLTGMLTYFAENGRNFSRRETPPTFLMPENDDTTPDLLLHTTNLTNYINNIQLTNELGSDHMAITFGLDLTLTQPTLSTPNQEKKLNLTKTDIDKVRQHIHNYIQSQVQTISIETIQQQLSLAIRKFTPEIKNVFYRHTLSKFILRLIKHKRELYRLYTYTQNNDLKNTLNQLNRNIKTLIQQYRQDKWLETCKEIEEDKGKTYWQKIKKLAQYKKTNTTGTIDENGIERYTGKERADAFARHYQKAFSISTNPKFDNDNWNKINDWYLNYFNNSPNYTYKLITDTEYDEGLSHIKNTAPGKDKIKAKLLKSLTQETHKLILSEMNNCIINNKIPKTWKSAVSSMKANIDAPNCILVQDVKDGATQDQITMGSESTQIPTEESLPTSTAEHSSATTQHSSLLQSAQQQLQWSPLPLEQRELDILHSATIPPYQFWHSEFRNKQPAFFSRGLSEFLPDVSSTTAVDIFKCDEAVGEVISRAFRLRMIQQLDSQSYLCRPAVQILEKHQHQESTEFRAVVEEHTSAPQNEALTLGSRSTNEVADWDKRKNQQ
ncbi:hypothetical protein HUJ05_000801 [Dendroctonus ponderosae]|nr:hypothetical protein HUJ05_000801 [Dendroctonus ponderosae]